MPSAYNKLKKRHPDPDEREEHIQKGMRTALILKKIALAEKEIDNAWTEYQRKLQNEQDCEERKARIADYEEVIEKIEKTSMRANENEDGDRLLLAMVHAGALIVAGVPYSWGVTVGLIALAYFNYLGLMTTGKAIITERSCEHVVETMKASVPLVRAQVVATYEHSIRTVMVAYELAWLSKEIILLAHNKSKPLGSYLAAKIMRGSSIMLEVALDKIKVGYVTPAGKETWVAEVDKKMYERKKREKLKNRRLDTEEHLWLLENLDYLTKPEQKGKCYLELQYIKMDLNRTLGTGVERYAYMPWDTGLH